MSLAVPSSSSTGSRRGIASALIILVLTLAAVLTTTPAQAGTTTSEKALLAKLNHARTSHGRHALVSRGDLAAVARAQARRMANSRRLYHNPHLTTAVTNWRWVGENVGYAPDIATVHRAFMHSRHHRANILDRDYTQVGVGVVVRDGRVWVAEVFRRPLRSTLRSTSTSHTSGMRTTRRYVPTTGQW